MLNKKELELLKQTGVNDKEVTEKLVNFLRHEFDNVVRVKKEDYKENIVKLVDNKQGSYTFIDNDSGDFLFKINIFNKEVDGENIGLSYIALNKQGWLLTKDDGNTIENVLISDLLDENNTQLGINLVEQLKSLDGETIATQEWVKQIGLPIYKPTGEENAQEYFSDKQAPFFLMLPNVEETLLIVKNNVNSELWGYAFKGYDNDKKYLSHIVIYIDDIDYTIDDLTIAEDEQEYFALLSGANFTGAITAPSIIETMSGYSFIKRDNDANYSYDYKYAGVSKTGNKITFAIFVAVTPVANVSFGTLFGLGHFIIPATVGAQLYPYTQGNLTNALECKKVFATSGTITGTDVVCLTVKDNGIQIRMQATPATSFTAGTEYLLRYEVTFLLSDNLAS